eukprot:TRINITY_DN592_c0_g1_i1.p1 TRINITY_DN592_c0_g1~~TRINITY_DN592_c0_g1_i1.p1  ORF type:complete len:148 (-),score=31.28 TRINITY_DN592_c0_g1_i1:97-540(-)
MSGALLGILHGGPRSALVSGCTLAVLGAAGHWVWDRPNRSDVEQTRSNDTAATTTVQNQSANLSSAYGAAWLPVRTIPKPDQTKVAELQRIERMRSEAEDVLREAMSLPDEKQRSLVQQQADVFLARLDAEKERIKREMAFDELKRT